MSTKTERNRDKILQKLFRYTNEERWFLKDDFEAAAREAGFKDKRTIFGDSGYWKDMQMVGTIEETRSQGMETFGRLSEKVYDQLDGFGTTLTMEATIEAKVKGKGKMQVVELRELM